VSMTGIAAGPVLSLDLTEAAQIVVETNKYVAEAIGVNPAARTTCVKPEGTATIAAEVIFFSGIHAGHSTTGYMVRRIRLGKEEPIYEILKNTMPSLMEDEKFNPQDMAVFTTPHKMPENCITRAESPIDLLERVRRWNSEWVLGGHNYGNNPHNVSCTVTIKDDEWTEVGEWMWQNRHQYTGLSVLPFDGTTYEQMPFEEIDKETFDKLATHVVDLDLTQMKDTRTHDDFTAEAACAGGACTVFQI
jgi:ribonucleoside-triphosphate reductase (thioredoxin)